MNEVSTGDKNGAMILNSPYFYSYDKTMWPKPRPEPVFQPVINENYIMKLQGEEIRLLKEEVETLKAEIAAAAKEKFYVRMSPELADEIQSLSEQTGMSRAEVFRRIVTLHDGN